MAFQSRSSKDSRVKSLTGAPAIIGNSSWLCWLTVIPMALFFFSSRRRHTRCSRDWSSDVCSSDLEQTFLELIKILKTNGDPNSVKGIVFKKDGKIFETPQRAYMDFSNIPHPDWT